MAYVVLAIAILLFSRLSSFSLVTSCPVDSRHCLPRLMGNRFFNDDGYDDENGGDAADASDDDDDENNDDDGMVMLMLMLVTIRK